MYDDKEILYCLIDKPCYYTIPDCSHHWMSVVFSRNILNKCF